MDNHIRWADFGFANVHARQSHLGNFGIAFGAGNVNINVNNNRNSNNNNNNDMNSSQLSMTPGGLPNDSPIRSPKRKKRKISERLKIKRSDKKRSGKGKISGGKLKSVSYQI